MISSHSNRHEDRRFAFRYCNAPGHHHTYCYWTPYVNCFDDYFEWLADGYSYLAGVSSYHDNKREDRRFKFYVCINTES
ncbi:hypothetical protein AALO_G00288130 [Alosa alosa]|uniref:Uncharacterized protein n=1 Tax=Alosa alosa TaxID=278164 RepID=A0AAV6FG40_9TELE|nr:hypothetical protein AALO_G00288130 [Alosa alosa]